MSPDISIIMPAFQAERTIAAAATSVLSGQGLAVELVICSDDGVDYRALLRAAGVGVDAVTHLYSAQVQSGPSAARNLAVDAAHASILAALDADDAYAPGRLRRIIGAMEREGLGAGTGALHEQTRAGERLRMARAADESGRLSLHQITTLRMPFSPVFERGLAPGWPPVGFAEDMVLNAHLCAAAGGYAFAQDAAYHYFIEPDSVVQGPQSLQAALKGYAQILDWLPGSWVHPAARQAIETVIREDIATAKSAMASAVSDWRAAFR